MSETLQGIIREMVERWLRDGEIVRESSAWAEMEKRTHGKISRTTAREIGQGRKTAAREDTFLALQELTGRDIPTLVAAARRWRPKKGSPQWQAMELERMRARVEELQRELEEVKSALPAVIEAADERPTTILDRLQEQGDKDTAEIVAELMPPRGRRAR